MKRWLKQAGKGYEVRPVEWDDVVAVVRVDENTAKSTDLAEGRHVIGFRRGADGVVDRSRVEVLLVSDDYQLSALADKEPEDGWVGAMCLDEDLALHMRANVRFEHAHAIVQLPADVRDVYLANGGGWAVAFDGAGPFRYFMPEQREAVEQIRAMLNWKREG